MSFTFQINENIKFMHNEELLRKADENKPKIVETTVNAKDIVEAVSDDASYLGAGIKRIADADEGLRGKTLRKGNELILDFGRHCVGYFSVDIEKAGSPMDAPLTLKIRFAEIPAELVADPASYDGWLSSSWIQEEILHIDELPYRLKLGRRYSFRYVLISVIDTSPKWGIRLSSPKAVAVSSAGIEPVKKYLSKDPQLQKIYEVGLCTLSECMQDVFEDGPKRDRRLWLGDLRLQALSNYHSFDITSIVKRCLYLFAGMTTQDGMISANVFTRPQYTPDDSFLFDYSLFFISVLRDYLEIHEGRELLEDLYPAAKKQMDKAIEYVNSKGELVLPENMPVFIDWSDEFDKTTCGQAVFIYALKDFMWLVDKKSEDNTRYEDICNRMTEYAISRLFDKERGLFISGEKREYNIASQVWMTLAHVLPEDTAKSVIKNTIDELFPVRGIATPYMYHHIAEALLEVGEKNEAIRLIKSYWGEMIRLGADTFWEAFDPDKPEYSPYGSPIVSSFCHAWSCTPLYLIQKYKL